LRLKQLDPFIGSRELRQVHMGNLQAFIARRRQDGVKTKTLNMALAVVRRVLNLASSEWMDRAGKTWLETAPKIKLFPIKDARPSYPLSLETSVFIIPGEQVKNGEERLVVLNRVAKSVINNLRGLHPVYVFVRAIKKDSEPKPVTKINNTAWRAARERAADRWQAQHGEPAPQGRFARAQKWSHHDALLPSRTDQLDRGRGQDLRYRVPQKSRNDMASAQNKLATEALTY